jgi:hypothetical protein
VAKAPNYPDLVEEAERSVQGVKDPELKRIAFQKVLDDLLGGATPGKQKPKQARVRSSSKKVRKTPQGGPTTYLREMIEEGFFKKPKAITDVKVELENRGHHIPLTSLSGPLQGLCKRKLLRRQKKDSRFEYANW